MFRQRGRFCLSTDLLTHFSQEEPFDLSQKPPGLRLSQSDGESVPGSSCQEEDEESLYRRSQYSPEVDQHELEEGGQQSPAERTPEEEKQKQMYQQGLDDQAYERGLAAGELSVESTDDKVHVLESEETSETAYESDSELGDQAYHHEAGGSQSYVYSSDSERENQQQEPNKPEQSKQQLGGFRGAREGSQSRLDTGEFMGAVGPDDDGDRE